MMLKVTFLEIGKEFLIYKGETNSGRGSHLHLSPESLILLIEVWEHLKVMIA